MKLFKINVFGSLFLVVLHVFFKKYSKLSYYRILEFVSKNQKAHFHWEKVSKGIENSIHKMKNYFPALIETSKMKMII